MKQLIFAIVTGIVNEVENDTAQVFFPTAASGFVVTEYISTDLLPCEVSEGDTIYIRKSENVTEIRCTEFPESYPPSLELRVDPATGEIQYIIKDIEIELE